MGFLNTDNAERNKLVHFFLTILVIISGFITIGQLPYFLLIFYTQNNSNELLVSNDQLIQNVGLNTYFVSLLFPFTIGVLALYVGVKFIHKKSFLGILTIRKRFDLNRFVFSFLAWGIVSSLSLIMLIVSGADVQLNFNAGKFFVLLIVSLTFLPIQTFFEEAFFRGYLFQGSYFLLRKGIFVVVFTGTLFGLLHGGNPEVQKIGQFILIYYIVSGIFLGLITLMDDGLELSLGYHAVNNIFAALILTNDWQAFHTDAIFIDKTPPSFGIENILTLLVFQPLLIFLFAKKYRWKNWKEKLLK